MATVCVCVCVFAAHQHPIKALSATDFARQQNGNFEKFHFHLLLLLLLAFFLAFVRDAK